MKIFHVINFKSVPPRLIVRKIGRFSEVDEIKLKGIIQFQLRPGRFCIRCFKKIKGGKECENCFKFNKNNFCAICNGDRCLLKKMICGPHYIYLAVFANILKVGVTSVKRFPERVIEQGADFAAAIAITENGLKARKIEKDIKYKFNIKDRLGSEFKRYLINKKDARKIGKEFLKTAYYEIIDSISPEIKLDLEILDFSDKYVEPEEKIFPLKLEDYKWIVGKVIGYKGNFIFLKSSKKCFSLNCNDLIGKVIQL